MLDDKKKKSQEMIAEESMPEDQGEEYHHDISRTVPESEENKEVTEMPGAEEQPEKNPDDSESGIREEDMGME